LLTQPVTTATAHSPDDFAQHFEAKVERIRMSTATSSHPTVDALLSALIAETSTAPLQRVISAAARLVCNLRSRESVTPALTELHWLPMEARVQYKLCLLVHLATTGKPPDYNVELTATSLWT